jgi:putative component of toxin-antitoxin plasmid stabilization module
MFRIFTTKEFDDNFNHLDESEKQRVRKILNQLKEKGDDIGKPLRIPYFREKKFDNKRLYFLVYEDFMIILVLAIGDKKTQQATIDRILSELKEYNEFIDKKLRELSGK